MTDRVFYVVPVVLTEREYNRLHSDAALTPDGTVAQAIRQKLDLYARALGERQLDEGLRTELRKVYRLMADAVELPCDNDPGEQK